MNRTLLFVFTSLFPLSISTSVIAQSSNFLATPTSPQAFHSVDSEPASNNQSSSPSTSTNDDQAPVSEGSPPSDGASSSTDDEEQMARIQEIEQKAKRAQQTSAQSATFSSPTAASPVTATPTQSLQAQIVRLGQMTTSSQQQMSDRITALSKQNQLLEQKINDVIKVIQPMQKVVMQMDAKPATQSVPQPVSVTSDQTARWFPWLVLLSVLVLLLVVANLYTLRLVRRQPSTPSSLTSSQDELEEEYNFMATEEAIPAKLDLVRAYIEMNDYQQAREVLTEILACKNPEFIAQAEVLLTSLSSLEKEKSDD